MSARRFAWIVLGVLVFVLYAASSNGIVSSNDGSHIALVKAIVEDGTFSIDRQIEFTRRLDYAEYNGHAYSDRPPGTALLALPAYLLARWAGTRWFTDPEHFTLVSVSALPAFVGAVNVLLVGAIARLGGARTGWALLAAFFYAVGTVQWRYGSALFSHGFAALAVLGCLHLLLSARVRGEGLTKGRKAALGALLGYSLAVEYPNLVAVAAVGAYLWWIERGEGESSIRGWVPALGGMAVPVALLMAYQWACFDNPFSTAYSHKAHFLWERHLVTTFTNDPLSGWANFFLVQIKQSNPGDFGGDGGIIHPILQTGPVLLAGFYGLMVLRRSRPAEAALMGGMVLIGITLIAAHKTYWAGTNDARYIMTWIAVLAPGIAWALQDVWDRLSQAGRSAAAVVLGLLLVFSFVQHLRMQADFLDHDDEGVPFVPDSFVNDLRRLDVVWDHAMGLPEHIRGLSKKIKHSQGGAWWIIEEHA